MTENNCIRCGRDMGFSLGCRHCHEIDYHGATGAMMEAKSNKATHALTPATLTILAAVGAKDKEIARLRWLLGDLFYAWKHEQRIDAETWEAIEQIVKEERGEK